MIFKFLARIFDSRNTPKPQIPQDAVFNINSGIATVLRPHIRMASALAPEMPHARIPKGPPMMTRPHCRSFSDKSGMAMIFPASKILLFF